MKVRGLDGKEHAWRLDKYVGKINNNPSKLHLRAREFLSSYFPACQILEEVFLPGEQLYLDFYIPTLRLAIESMGRQHGKFIQHFHGTKNNFRNAVGRDSRKSEWCKNNGIELVYFLPDEDEKQWQMKLAEL